MTQILWSLYPTSFPKDIIDSTHIMNRLSWNKINFYKWKDLQILGQGQLLFSNPSFNDWIWRNTKLKWRHTTLSMALSALQSDFPVLLGEKQTE